MHSAASQDSHHKKWSQRDKEHFFHHLIWISCHTGRTYEHHCPVLLNGLLSLKACLLLRPLDADSGSSEDNLQTSHHWMWSALEIRLRGTD